MFHLHHGIIYNCANDSAFYFLPFDLKDFLLFSLYFYLKKKKYELTFNFPRSTSEHPSLKSCFIIVIDCCFQPWPPPVLSHCGTLSDTQKNISKFLLS